MSPEGIEPSTFGVRNRCCYLLSYGLKLAARNRPPASYSIVRDPMEPAGIEPAYPRATRFTDELSSNRRRLRNDESRALFRELGFHQSPLVP